MVTDRKTLREWRASRRLSMAALAKLADVSEATVESIENGRHTPSLKSMRQIADVFGVGLDQIDWPERVKPSKTLAPVA